MTREGTIDWKIELTRLVSELDLPDTLRQATVDLEMVSTRKIQALNTRYRSINRPTDVLSFPLYTHLDLLSTLDQTPDLPVLLGTLVICPAMVQARAERSVRSYDEQLGWTIRHGLMHLLGYNHPPDEERWVVGNVS